MQINDKISRGFSIFLYEKQPQMSCFFLHDVIKDIYNIIDDLNDILNIITDIEQLCHKLDGLFVWMFSNKFRTVSLPPCVFIN